MSIFDGLGLKIFCRKMEKTTPMREETYEKVFISRQSRLFVFVDIIIEHFSLIVLRLGVCNIMFHVNEKVSRRKTKKLLFEILIITWLTCWLSILLLVSIQKSHILLFSQVWLEYKNYFNLHHCLTFSLQKMATLGNCRRGMYGKEKKDWNWKNWNYYLF